MEKKYNGFRNGLFVYIILAFALILCKIFFMPTIPWWAVALVIILPAVVLVGFLWAIISL